jgi:hypothetical protein
MRIQFLGSRVHLLKDNHESTRSFTNEIKISVDW